jgi:hypothetical protein
VLSTPSILVSRLTPPAKKYSVKYILFFNADPNTRLLPCQEFFTEFFSEFFFTVPVGKWSEPVLLGHGVNTADTDCCPMVTPGGRHLFFSRRAGEPKDAGWDRVVGGDVYWISRRVIEALRP